MKHSFAFWLGLILAGWGLLAAVPPAAQGATPQSTTKKKRPAAKSATAKTSTAKSAHTKTGAKRKTARRSRVPKPPKVAVEVRQESSEFVHERLTESMEAGIQNPAAMVPFYELLFRLQGGSKESLHVLQFGDSHTASDDWPASLREAFQKKFGNGGPGFTHAGHPFLGDRRFDAKGLQSRGWKTEGLLNREGDGRYGLSGVAVTTDREGETLTLEANGSALEVLYEKQPGGGTFTLEENGKSLGSVETAGEAGAGSFEAVLPDGPHQVTLRTTSHAPVRIFGWTLDRPSGITWETLGINGAQADLLLHWDPAILKAQIEQRNPAMIVLAYGTNEARFSEWTYESYKESLTRVIGLLRAAAPAASILIIGAPDQSMRVRGRWTPYDGVDRIVTAQRDVALANGCAFWNLRASMGGKGSMKQWVQAGLAQGDFVHMTGTGYRLLGESLYALLMGQYDLFRSVRAQVMGAANNGPSSKDY